MKEYTNKYLIGPGETDLHGLCRPSALLVSLQDVATLHAGAIGMSRETLVKDFKAIWILARLWYQLDHPIKGGETISITTWHRGLKGAIWYRDFLIERSGCKVGKAVTAWVLADLNTHRVRRPTGMEEIDRASANPDASLNIELGKLSAGKERKLIFEKEIRYSDLDINAHLNNTRYADLCCDAVDYAHKPGMYLSQMQINYTKECVLGDKLSVYLSGDERYAEGIGQDDKQRFDACMEFSPQNV